MGSRAPHWKPTNTVKITTAVQRQMERERTSTKRGFEPFPSTFFRYGVDYPAALARSDSDGGPRRDLFPLAGTGTDHGNAPHARPTRCAASRLPLPPSPGYRLLLHPTAQSLPAAL